MKFTEKERAERCLKYYGDIFDVHTMTEMRKINRRANKRAKAIAKAKKEADRAATREAQRILGQIGLAK